MLGLGLPQLILIFAGLCFMIAGIYGLAPTLVTDRFGASSSSQAPAKDPHQQSKKQAKQAAYLAKQQADAAKKAAEAAKKAAEAAKLVEAKAEAAKKKEASVIIEKSAVQPTTASVARIEAPVPVVVAEAPAAAVLPPDSVVMDTELVEELFAEMFALRSTVAGLVGEVQQLRSEQKPRRFVIEEVAG